MLPVEPEHWVSVNPAGGMREVGEHRAARGRTGTPLRGGRAGAAEAAWPRRSRLQLLCKEDYKKREVVSVVLQKRNCSKIQ